MNNSEKEDLENTESINNTFNQWIKFISINCKASTYSKYNNMFQNHIKEYFEDIDILKIDNNVIDDFVKHLLLVKNRNGNTLSRKTIQDILSCLKQILIYGEENFNLKIGISNKHFKIKQVRKNIEILSVEELSKLINYLLSNTNSYKLSILITLYTGLRIGEICALKWEDIDLTNSVINVSKTAIRIQTADSSKNKTKLIIQTPKTASSIRCIPISKKIKPIIKKLKSEPDNYVVNQNLYIPDPRYLQVVFKKCLKEAGIRDIKFHTLRHTFASKCVQQGFDIKTLSEILGHSSVNITLNTYVHTSMSVKKKYMDKIDF